MKCKNCKGRGFVIALNPDYQDIFKPGTGGKPLIDCSARDLVEHGTEQIDCPKCKGSGTVAGPSFHFDISGNVSLGVDGIWPDADYPDDPTPQDVADLIKRDCHMLAQLLTDWNIDSDCLTLTITTSNGTGLVELDPRLKVTRSTDHKPFACKRCRSVDGCACKARESKSDGPYSCPHCGASKNHKLSKCQACGENVIGPTARRIQS